MFRLYLRLTLLLAWITCAAAAAMLLPRAYYTPTALVYSQFRQGTGYYFVYVDVLHGIRARHIEPRENVRVTSERAMSPDGKTYVAAYPTLHGVDLFAIEMEAGVYRQLTETGMFDNSASTMRSNTYPVWSPDGEWIAFVSSNAIQVDIYIISATGDILKRVARDVSSPAPLQLRWGSFRERRFDPLPLVIVLALGAWIYPKFGRLKRGQRDPV